jgi:cytochrome c-type biogenesis protein
VLTGTAAAHQGLAAAIGIALLLGIQTSISPCPLATNIAAVSYIGRRVGRPGLVLASGVLYTLGRMLVYIALGWLLTQSLISASSVSMSLQHYMNLLLGPLLVLIGMFLLELFGTRWTGVNVGEAWQRRAERLGIWGAALLGIVFALAFCPVSAAFFFGGLLTLAVQNKSPLLLPAVFGAGTALPAFLFAVVIALSAGWVGVIFDKLRVIEFWARRIAGLAFILAGIYMSLHYIWLVI